ncbi:major facilitator superfamily domain-containing protein [Absidia repens]|uniref:Major facilitator superfamily domain-containing protein n=1 Tax=Absidia repens TaxID=90262 RepID=A0A1X2IEV2_9FUNG|nr:major facilitator superfamily domain-containing protein [Absidia repens]
MGRENTENQNHFEHVLSNNSSTISNHNTVHIETPPPDNRHSEDIEKEGDEQEPTIAEIPLEKKKDLKTIIKVGQWGNYQQLYLEIYAGETDTFRISFVGTLASTVLLSSGVFLTPVIQKLGYRGTMALGAVLAPLGMVLSSFSTSLWHIYLSQGLLFGLGSGLCFAPSIALPSQFFDKNRSLATGLAVSGSGIGGVCLSPMTQRLIETLGYRNTLRIEGAFGFGLLALATALAFSNSRPGAAQGGKGGAFAIVDRSIIDHDLLVLMSFCTLITFGYLGPFFLAPQYVKFLGRYASDGAALVSIMSGMNSVSRIVMGFLADRLGKLNTMFACTFAAGIFTSVVWQFSTAYDTYIAYCVLYGLTGGAFVSLLPVVIADIVGVKNIQRGIGMCYTITLFGSLLGTPIIGKLLEIYDWSSAIQFSGATTIGSGLILLYLRMKRSGGKLFMVI